MNEPTERFPQTPSEFRSFIKTNQGRLVRHAFFKLGVREEAEDIVQEVMIRIFRERERNHRIEKPVPYAFRMVYNACIDRLRKNTTRFETLDGKGIHSASSDTTRESDLIAREESNRVNRLLLNLPFEQAEVIRLRILDEMSFVEIAGLLEIPVTTIKSRFSYGIIKLRNQLSIKEEMNYEMQ